MIGAIFSTIFFGLQFATVKPAEGAGFATTNIGYVATTSSATLVTTSARILATTTVAGAGYIRTFASICNAGSVTVYIRMDGDKATNINTGGAIPIAAGACYEISDRNSYFGSVTASSTNETSARVLVQEYVM